MWWVCGVGDELSSAFIESRDAAGLSSLCTVVGVERPDEVLHQMTERNRAINIQQRVDIVCSSKVNNHLFCPRSETDCWLCTWLPMHLLPVCWLVTFVVRFLIVMSSAKLMIWFVLYVAVQSWAAPVLRVVVWEKLIPIQTVWGLKSRNQNRGRCSGPAGPACQSFAKEWWC